MDVLSRNKFLLFVVIIGNVILCQCTNFWNPKTVDFIVVGAGASGAPVAARLVETNKYTVAIIEAGSEPPYFNLIPYFTPGPFHGKWDWNFVTEKQEHCCQAFKNQKWSWPRGKGLGGSTIINSLAYSRGHRKDYDQWDQLGNKGWGYEDVLPYFKKMEDYKGPILDADHDKYHGVGGPVEVTTPSFRTVVADVFLDAGKELGYKHVDYNGKSMTGFANPLYTTKNGSRCSTNYAYIQPLKHHKNFHILTEAYVTKVLFDDKKKATGVLFEKDGQIWQLNVKKEVIISAGTAQSPQLLLLSGIGPKETLKKFEIPIVKELSGVGQNLVDHLSISGVLFTINETLGFDRRFDVTPETMDLWETHRQGPLTVPVRGEGIAFLNSKYSDEDYPDFELQFFQTAGNHLRLPRDVYNKAFGYKDHREMFLIHPIVMRPKSVGYITLKSSDPHDPPLIQPNYVSDPYDAKVLRDSVEISLKLMQTTAFKKLGVEWHGRLMPGCEDYKEFSDDYWDCYIRRYSYGFYHQSGTCKMGPSKDPMAVVDNHLRVYGVSGLRVIDMSMTPTIVSGHTMAPAIMIGEKGADLIIQDWKTTKEEL